MALVRFPERFWCYLEGSTFEAIIDNLVLKRFSANQNFSGTKARKLEIIGSFGIFHITLKPEEIQVLVEAMSRVPNGEAVVNDIEK